MKKAVVIALISVGILTGCGLFSKNSAEKVEPPAVNNRVVVDPKLLQPCDPLQPLPPNPNFDDIATHYITTIGMYGTCKLKQDDSVKTIRKLANIEAAQ